MKMISESAIWRRFKQWCWQVRMASYRKNRRRGWRSAKEVMEKFLRTPAERAKDTEQLRDLDPGRHEPGYDARTGATIYPDSVTLVPYIGSAQEEEDAAKPKMPLPPGKKRFGPYTCETCFGWGGECPVCKGKGWR